MKLDYPILSDPDGKVAKEFGIYNSERNFASRVTFYIGKDNKILKVDDKVNVGEHGADVAKTLKELDVPRAESE